MIQIKMGDIKGGYHDTYEYEHRDKDKELEWVLNLLNEKFGISTTLFTVLYMILALGCCGVGSFYEISIYSIEGIGLLFVAIISIVALLSITKKEDNNESKA